MSFTEFGTQAKRKETSVAMSDVDAIWERLQPLGLPIVNAIGDRPYRIRDFVVADPSGFDVRFAQVLE